MGNGMNSSYPPHITPLCTVIIPVYNVVCYLRATLNSVLNQTLMDWEAICVDDGSRDGSGSLLDEAVRRDGRFRVVHQRNGGVSVARNRALDIAKGRYVSFLDGDDVLIPDLLCRVTQILGADTVDVVTWSYYLFDEDADVRDVSASCQTDSTEGVYELLFGDSAISYFIAEKIPSGFVWTCCIRHALVGETRFPAGVTHCEDMRFLSELAGKIQSVAVLHKVGLCYRQRCGQATSSRRASVYQAKVDAWLFVFHRYYVLCDSSPKLYILLAHVLSVCVAGDTIAQCCYGGSENVCRQLKRIKAEAPDIMPRRLSLKGLCVWALSIAGISVIVALALRICGIGLNRWRRIRRAVHGGRGR